MIPLMRIALILLALLVVFTNPEEFIHGSTNITVLLWLYACYGIGLYLRDRKRQRDEMAPESWVHWCDVGWCTALVYLSGGYSSVFFVGFVFPVFIASFYWGFTTGLRVTLLSTISFMIIILLPQPGLAAGSTLKFPFLEAMWILAIGYILANWGELEIIVRRRLKFVNDTMDCSNPRFGIDRTVALLLESLNGFYGAQRSLIILADSKKEDFLLQHSGNFGSEPAAHFETVSKELAQRLLELSPEQAAVFNARPEGWWHFGSVHQLLDVTFDRITNVRRSRFAALAEVLNGKAFVTVPFQCRNIGAGRLYVIAANHGFVPSDMRFLFRFMDQMGPIIDNIKLIEQLAEHAADDERHKIAREIHDSVIQPYFGLQLGLEAIRNTAKEHSPEVVSQIEQLIKITDSGISDLRHYMAGLRKKEASGEGFLAAMRSFASKFTEQTGIAVEIEAHGNILANERLAAEAFQLMREGLSNIRKHTHTLRAKVQVSCSLNHLILEIMNDGPKRKTAMLFTPESITERAQALGGSVRVKTLSDGGHSVVVSIPL